MNGSRSKALRHLASKHAQGMTAEYKLIGLVKALWHEKKKKWVNVARYQVKCTGYRAVYQALKKAYYQGRRNGN